MRAAENHRWILRVTNDGITAAIDPRGRVVDQMVPFEQTAAIMQFGYEHELTFYTRHGDWFAWGCLAMSLAMSLALSLALTIKSAVSPARRRL